MTDGRATDRHTPLKADRLVYFSDAVVAIAITLLVLPLVDLVPEALERHESTAEILRDNVGPVSAFLLGFFVIARLWIVHHAMFDGVERIARAIVVVDLFWLLTIVVLPFPTALTGAASDDPGVVRLYVGVLTASMLALTLLAVLVRGGFAEASVLPDLEFTRGVGATALLLVAAFVVSLLMPRPTFAVLFVLLADPAFDVVRSLVRRLRS